MKKVLFINKELLQQQYRVVYDLGNIFESKELEGLENFLSQLLDDLDEGKEITLRLTEAK